MPKLTKTRPTIGLEIEFLIPYRVTDSLEETVIESGIAYVPTGDGHPYHQAEEAREEIHEGIKESIISAGNKAQTISMFEDTPLTPEQLWPDTWIVRRDVSVYEKDPKDYSGFVEVELNTPIYKVPPDDDEEAQKWPQVTKTVEKINADWPRIHVNKECAYQVNVGLPTRYQLLDIKKLSTILWLSETRLQNMYSPYRRQENSWYNSLSKYSRLARTPLTSEYIPNNSPEGARDRIIWHDMQLRAGNYRTGKSSRDFEQWIGTGSFGDCLVEVPLPKIQLGASSSTQGAYVHTQKLEDKIKDLWKAEDGKQICSMLAPDSAPKTGTRLAYNFNSVFDSKGTVEFRRMESAIDPLHLQNWATVCYKLVIFAKDTNVQGFKLLLSCLLKDEGSYDVWDLLKDIKCQPSVISWFKTKNAEMR